MSEILTVIEEAQRANERAAELLTEAADLASQESATPDFTDLLSEVDDALTAVGRAEDNVPTRYTEVGSVDEMGDALEGYLSDLSYSLRGIRDSLENFQN